MTSFNLNCLFKGPISKQSHSALLQVRASTFWGTQLSNKSDLPSDTIPRGPAGYHCSLGGEIVLELRGLTQAMCSQGRASLRFEKIIVVATGRDSSPCSLPGGGRVESMLSWS